MLPFHRRRLKSPSPVHTITQSRTGIKDGISSLIVKQTNSSWKELFMLPPLSPSSPKIICVALVWLSPCALIDMRVEAMSECHLALQGIITKSKRNSIRRSLERAAKRTVEETIFIYACVFTIEELMRVTLYAS
jgi:hypothetical protein